MLEMLLNIPRQSVIYQITLLILVVLILECAGRLRQLRFGISALVFLTIGLWYYIDPIYRFDAYEPSRGEKLDTVFLQVLAFVITFRILAEVGLPTTPSHVLRSFDPKELDRGPFIGVLLVAWGVLFLIGMFRAEFQFLQTLFPLESRWNQTQMWARGRFGGTTDFLVSVGFYCYLMCCAAMGLVAIATRRTALRMGLLILILLTWPMFALSGNRSHFLAVCLPSILAILVLRKWNRAQQVFFLAICFVLLNTLMLISIAFREKGVGKFFQEDSYSDTISETKHAGLNMPEELAYINEYQRLGLLEPEWGYEYFAQAVNFVPRAIWPGKPFPGEKFAALRVGYYQGQVAATISNGLVGQGVQNFGKWIGPIVAASLMAILASLVCQLPRSGNPFLRSFLVIFIMALIPNLGRDLTLFTLWPAVFAFAGIKYYEGRFSRRSSSMSRKTRSS